MFMAYSKENFTYLINKQIKKQYIKMWKIKFNKSWNLPIIYENVILCDIIIINNYF
jgi:hypothetical protein